MPRYKVSYVVPKDPGAGVILSQREAPRVGQVVELHGKKYRITEVINLLPRQGLTIFLHATLEPVITGENQEAEPAP